MNSGEKEEYCAHHYEHPTNCMSSVMVVSGDDLEPTNVEYGPSFHARV